MDLDLFRRDQIYLLERDKIQKTKLSAISDFSVRNNDDIEKHYKAGHFGAKPRLISFTARDIYGT